MFHPQPLLLNYAAYMELEAINKWNGTLPQYMTSNTAVPFVPVK
ncbi:hypothetical protein [Vagococcus sp. WN89Y]